MFGTSFGTDQAARPLHRMASLWDDPAAAWLSKDERARVGLLVFFLWSVYAVCIPPTWFAIFLFLGFLRAGILTVVIFSALFRPVRRSILRTRSERIEQILRRNASEVAADDWTRLGAEPDEKVASVVGWVRGRQYLPKPIGGEKLVGVALPCQQTFPGVFESLHDFDLVDEEGRTILVQVAGARTLSGGNITLESNDLRLLYAACEIPGGITHSGWHVFALRDGDPVMVLGSKRTVIDPTQSGFRSPPQSLALVSTASAPLLIFSLAAERRPPQAAAHSAEM
jgi:hypothetical protein